MRDQGARNNAANYPDEGGRPSVSFVLASISTITGVLVLLLVLYPGWPLGLRLGLVAVFALVHLLPGFRKHSSIFCQCLLPILIGSICVEAYVLLNGWPVTNDFMKYFRLHSDYRESFYGAISTLYAIITALALVKGIEDFDAMKGAISDEAHRVRTIDEMARYFDAHSTSVNHEVVLGLRRQLIRYASNVAALRDRTVRGENLTILRGCQQSIAQLVPQDANDERSLSAMMTAHGELGTLRAKRIGAVGERIPSYLIVALWLMALGLILPFMSGPLDEQGNLGPLRFGQYYIIFLMGALNSFLLLMLSDISDPFEGFWQIDLGGFKDIADAMTAEFGDAEDASIRSAPQ